MSIEIKNTMTGKDYAAAIIRSREKVLRVYGIKIAGYAITMVPVDTGRLRGSITYQTKKRGSVASNPGDGVSRPQRDDECFVGTNVEYAGAVEFGTSRSPGGNPYLRPAVDVVKTGGSLDAAKQIKEEMRQENMGRNL